MFKKATVVMLPTNQKAQDCLLLYNRRLNPLQANKGYYTQEYLKEYNIQANHLYIISDEEIKEGDWVYTGNKIKQVKEVTNKHSYLVFDDETLLSSDCKKIIATTDNLDAREKGLRLPQPSQSFIDKYISEYNKGNQIVDVMVEYEEFALHYQGNREPNDPSKLIKLKVNLKDNTITIKRIKDSWTREEVEALCLSAFNSGSDNTDSTGHCDLIHYYNFIEQNL